MLNKDLYGLSHDKIVELFTLDLNPIGVSLFYRFCAATLNNGQALYFQGLRFEPLPIDITGFSRGLNENQAPTMRIGNANRAVTLLTLAYQDLRGAIIQRQRTLAKFLDHLPTADATKEYPRDLYRISQKTEEDSLSVTFALAPLYKLGAGSRIPARVITRNTCQWIYRGEGCGYTGAPVADANDNPTNDPLRDNCSLSVTGCRFRFGNELNIGCFPGVDNYRA